MSVLETVLRCDRERTELLQEEARLLSLMNPLEPNGTSEKKPGKSQDRSEPDASSKLEKVGFRVMRAQGPYSMCPAIL